MIHTHITVRIPAGIHAEIAHNLRHLGSGFTSSIFIRHLERTASLQNIPALLALGVTAGTEIQLTSDGPDEVAAIAAIIRALQPSAPPKGHRT